jgi:hypothetical protein
MSSISRLAAAIALVGVGLTGMPIAQADPGRGPSYSGGNCPAAYSCTHWCPGDALYSWSNMIAWDWNVCHDWYWNSEGIVDVISNTMYPWSGGPPHPAAPPPPIVGTPPPPPQKPPGTPFCSPRGALIIIPPICDEIGVDWPPGSLRR